MKQPTNNYARCRASGQIVFFNDATAPSFAHPGMWAFYRRPRGVDAAEFRGQIVGENPAESPVEIDATDAKG
jgi:hypothetical protein